MKHFLYLLFFFLPACSGRNDIATQLLNDKRAAEDSIKQAGNYETYYMQKAKEEMRSSHDSLKWMPLADSSTYYFGKGHMFKERLKAIEFSIDSLSKMK